ncbi:hypothetical protein HaLaN_31097, partial [Haematococcus lacustris]
MHRASRLELGFYASIVAVLQLIVLRDAILLSDSAAAAITDVSDVQWREFSGSLGRLAAGLG